MRPACVYLDLGNVLFWFDRDRAFRQMAAVSGTSPEAVRRVVMDEGLQASLERGQIDWEHFHRDFSRRTATTSDPAALALAASDMFRLNAALLPVIAGLVRCRVALGVLSNTCAPHWRQLVAGDYAVLREGLRHVVLSHEAGCAKPDPAIYRLATERAGVPPECIFFTDDLPEHVAAARAAGWDAEPFVSATELARSLAHRGLNVGL